MTKLYPGQPLSPSPESLRTLGAELSAAIDDLEREYQPLFNKFPHWWDWYEATPRTSQKNWPWRGASNIVVPVIQLMSDALLSRTLASFFGAGNRVCYATTERGEDAQRRADNVARAFNWAARGNDFDFKLVMYDWLSELYPLGSSVFYINWYRDTRPVYFGSAKSPQVAQVQFNRGVQFESVPRENVLWDTRLELAQAPLVVRKHDYSANQLRAFLQASKAGRDHWDIEALQDILDRGPSRGGEDNASLIRTHKDRIDDRASDLAGSNEPYDIREVYVEWPVLRSLDFQPDSDVDPMAPAPPLIAHIDRNSRRVLRLVAYPYHLPYVNAFAGYFRKRSGRGHGVGVSKKLEHLQLGITTMFNQAIDSVTRANAVWAKTRDNRHLRQPIDMAHPIYDPDGSFEPLDLPSGIQPNMQLITGLYTMSERLIGINDPATGRETRHGGHPSPATSTLALLQQTETMASSTLQMLRHEVGRAMEAWAALTQQYETNEDGKLQRVFGATDADDMNSLLFPQEPIPLNYQFDLVAMSDTLNPDTEMRRAVTVDQMSTAYWSFVLQGVQVISAAAQGQAPPELVPVWTKAIQSKTNTYRRFLDAANVDDAEKFLLQLREANDNAGIELQRAAAGLGELAAGNGAVPGQGPLGAPGVGAAQGTGAPAPPGGALI